MSSICPLLKKGLALLVLLIAFAGAANAQAVMSNFQIAPGDLSTALNAFASQSRLQILYSPKLVEGKKTGGLSGNYAPQQALNRLLQGTGLQARTINATTYVLKAVPATERPVPAASSAKAPLPPPPTELAKVQVTGTRLLETTNQGPLPVNVYTRKQINQSGQTTIQGFLNTLPEVSFSTTESALQAFSQNQGYSGNTTVQLRGLPSGATAVLLDGHRLETTGTTNNTFNLNLIPIAAVERIEIVPQGSSAVYGSDALAGVVNIILKKDFDGMQVDGSYGSASDTDEKTDTIAWGKTWQRGHLSIVGTYYKRDALLGTDRAITANQDYTRFGGPDARVTQCNPGNVYSEDGTDLPGLPSSQAGVPHGLSGTASIADFETTAGQLNKCSNRAFADQIPPTERFGGLLTGSYQLTDSVELFTDLVYSRVHQNYQQGLQTLSHMSLGASNPFNPFGEDVLVDYRFDDPEVTYGLDEHSVFYQALVGLRGDIAQSWSWELSAWQSKDMAKVAYYNVLRNYSSILTALNSGDPAAAFNPFVENAIDPSILHTFFSTADYDLTGQTRNISVLLRGPLFTLPAGQVQAAFGTEYRQDGFFQSSDVVGYTGTNATSHSRAIYGEVRAPLLGNANSPHGRDVLAVTAALRYDDYSSFGGRFTPQGGIEWRPSAGLLIRGAYSEAYKAPSAQQLSLPATTFPYPPGYLFDPRRNGEGTTPNVTTGGNPALAPETGNSYSVGAIWDSQAIDGLHAAVTRWVINIKNSATFLDPQTLIDNEVLFPGRVEREPDQNGLPGVIEFVDDTYINFGRLSAAGIDFDFRYRLPTYLGIWEPSLQVTETTRYQAAVTPGAPTSNRVSQATETGWAPRCKASVGLVWSRDVYSADLAARYVSGYRDYDGARSLGNIWFFDANARMDVGKLLATNNGFWSGTYVSIGAVNLFNSLPKFSNFRDGFAGYDPSQYDIRGRFVYFRIGSSW